MADGFGAVAFDVYIRQPWGNFGCDYTATPIPGGSVAYVDVGGMQPHEETLAVGLASENDFASLAALVRTAATLTVNSTTYANAVLVRLKRTRVVPVEADAIFIIP